MLRAGIAIAVLTITVGTAFGQASTGEGLHDFCPELQRTKENPSGNRDCGPGCIEEENFSFPRGLWAFDELEKYLFEPQEGDGWEASIGKSQELDIAKGTLLRLRLLIAYQSLLANEKSATAEADYQQYRKVYCDFLRDDAIYLD
jgi:hypothetical protein